MKSPHLAPALQDDAVYVLVVEDEFIVRFSIADELRSAGLKVVEAATADEAWRYLQSDGRADLIFSDIQTPGSMDGVELAQRVLSQYPTIALILTSGNSKADSVDTLAPFIGKPYQFDHVVTVILETLQRPR